MAPQIDDSTLLHYAKLGSSVKCEHNVAPSSLLREKLYLSMFIEHAEAYQRAFKDTEWRFGDEFDMKTTTTKYYLVKRNCLLDATGTAHFSY